MLRHLAPLNWSFKTEKCTSVFFGPGPLGPWPLGLKVFIFRPIEMTIDLRVWPKFHRQSLNTVLNRKWYFCTFIRIKNYGEKIDSFFAFIRWEMEMCKICDHFLFFFYFIFILLKNFWWKFLSKVFFGNKLISADIW